MSDSKKEKRISLTTEQLYRKAAGSFPLLSAEEEVHYAKKYQAGDYEAYETLINSNLRLVIGIAGKYTNRGLDFIELIGFGNEGLERGIEKYDPYMLNPNNKNKPYRISTLVTRHIENKIDRGVRENCSDVRVPLNVQKDAKHVSASERKLSKEFRREPTALEIANDLDVTEDSVNNVYAAGKLKYPTYLDEPVKGKNNGEYRNHSLVDTFTDTKIVDPYDILAISNLSGDVHKIMQDAGLDDEEIKVLSLRFGLDGCNDYTLEEVGEIMGFSNHKVRNIQIKALERLKTFLIGNNLGSDDFVESSHVKLVSNEMAIS